MSGLEADPHRDFGMRQVAIGVVEILLGRLQDPAAAEHMLFYIHEHGGVGFQFHTKLDREKIAQSEGVDPEDFPEDVNFQVVFVPVSEGGVGAHWDGANHTMVFKVLPEDMRERIKEDPRGFWDYIINTMEILGTAVAHEAIHMLDQLRGNPRLKGKPPYGEMEPGSEEWFRVYYNTPEEANAHFQQGLIEMESVFAQLPERDLRKTFKSFDNFLKVANVLPSISPLNKYLTPENLKKMRSRLWQTYEMFKRREQL